MGVLLYPYTLLGAVYPDLSVGTTEVYYISLVKEAGPGGSALFVRPHHSPFPMFEGIENSCCFQLFLTAEH